mgnify:CR=1 FL=1
MVYNFVEEDFSSKKTVSLETYNPGNKRSDQYFHWCIDSGEYFSI